MQWYDRESGSEPDHCLDSRSRYDGSSIDFDEKHRRYIEEIVDKALPDVRDLEFEVDSVLWEFRFILDFNPNGHDIEESELRYVKFEKFQFMKAEELFLWDVAIQHAIDQMYDNVAVVEDSRRWVNWEF
ncbi:hypothetical protein GPJ56_000697 [Histomonas meleagridis]|uniref:uncharacterized protein n=1 Tax=Histomonas meleagridis TaxID=135588 RepID=UPI00355A25C5|nr:hypothetical protein GPJ56_000697 [Histomonas meleagridis]KAH0802394.1 hypothetical protein GO595_004808 [Histomonas meleagridis]